MLSTAFYALKRDAAPGVDGMTWETYERDLDRKIENLHARVQNGAYRALPSRRSYIPKEDGKQGAHSRLRLSRIKSYREPRLRC